jgi:DtxR family Mn-dependent transcriptional regulator
VQAPAGALSTAQEDYLETIYQLEREAERVRITSIAVRLGVKLPPVTRAVQGLEKLGFVEHEARREVRLTQTGRRLARALAHRHADLVCLLTEILAVPPEVARTDTCRMEHGISAVTAQRLHEFLEHYLALAEKTRGRLRAGRIAAAFRFLPRGRGPGWRA